MKELMIREDAGVMQTPIEVALQIDEQGYTTARKLYEWLGLDEGNYSRWVKQNILDNAFAEEGVDFSSLMKKSRKGVMGRPTSDYLLSASFAKKLAMSQRSERGEQARIYFLMCEQALAQAVKAKQKLQLERAKGTAVRKSLTDVILQSGENERMKGHGYATYTDLVYRHALGESTKQLRERYGLEKKDNPRDWMSEDELARVNKAEGLVASLIDNGFTYDGVKQFLGTLPQEMAPLPEQALSA